MIDTVDASREDDVSDNTMMKHATKTRSTLAACFLYEDTWTINSDVEFVVYKSSSCVETYTRRGITHSSQSGQVAQLQQRDRATLAQHHLAPVDR